MALGFLKGFHIIGQGGYNMQREYERWTKGKKFAILFRNNRNKEIIVVGHFGEQQFKSYSDAKNFLEKSGFVFAGKFSY